MKLLLANQGFVKAAVTACLVVQIAGPCLNTQPVACVMLAGSQWSSTNQGQLDAQEDIIQYVKQHQRGDSRGKAGLATA